MDAPGIAVFVADFGRLFLEGRILMKRWITLLLVLLMLFSMMAACGQAEPSPDVSADPDQNISVEPEGQEDQQEKPPETELTPESSEPEESTEPEYPTPQDLGWVIEQPEKLSYEEYFSEARSYATSDSWLVPDGDVYKGYYLNLHIVHGLQVCRWMQDAGSEENAIYTVPNTTDLGGWEQWHLVGTDGTTAYVMKLGDVNCIISVDLLTGERQSIVDDAVIADAVYCGDVLFYGLYADGTIQIVRHYIPTGDEMTYSTGQKLVSMFFLDKPASSESPITWTGVTEEMTAAVLSELQNTESPYRSDDRVPPYLWDINEPWIYAEHNPLHWFCCALQEDTGYHTLYKCEIGTDGSVISEATGIVDSCWYGSGYPHDHYNPDAPAPAKPTSNIGSWMPLVDQICEEGEESLDYNLQIYRNHLYQTDGNTFTLLTDIPIKDYYITEADYGDFINAYYGITVDNKLVRIYLDGTEPAVLYQGQHDIRQVSVEGARIYIGDGDTIVELDLQTQQWRTVFTHADLSWFYCDYGNENVLYIDLASGLHVVAYLYDLTTGKLTETGYRL